jgi:hypothetical protein
MGPVSTSMMSRPRARVETDSSIALEGPRERGALVAGGLRVEFRWEADRWSHRIEVLDAEGAWTAMAVARQGDAATERPEAVFAPAWQQLHLQEGEGVAVGLAVGQSGRHKFSASFLLPDPDDHGTATLSIDLADRMPGGDPILACSYLVPLPASTLIDASPDRALWQPFGPGRGTLTVEPLAPEGPEPTTSLVVADQWYGGLAVQALGGVVPGASSQRCRFRWSWTTSASTT